MSILITESVKQFREKLAELSREELLEIIKDQDVDYIKQINRIEYVFRNKLRHLTWRDGSQVTQRDLTKEELILLIDPPFIYDREMAKLGFTEEQQRQIHIASDPVLWARHFLKDKPRVYQVLVLRGRNSRKVMRFGRRLGKTFTFAIFCLWYSYTTNEGKILVMAPMKSHVGLIYDEVLRLAKQNDLILPSNEAKKGAIIRNVTSPQYEIGFDNGSSIKFFTTGMKSNSKADVARGQEADIIILDEMDYMGKEDLDALLAMLQTTSDRKIGEKQLMGASTPTGQRNNFYNWNENPEFGFTSFWFPSYCNPFWNKKIEQQMRVDYPNEQVYKHEIEADYGEDIEGVYPQQYIKYAFQEPGWDYRADVFSARSDFVFGVDWDKYGAGVNVVVLEICNASYELDQFAGKTRLAYREEINKGEFTYTGAVDRIIELNSIFRPKHIYVDRGAGEVQVELLHKYGMDHPETRLHKVVKGYQFSESIEVRDPYTQQLTKKDLKPFMVDNLYKMLESQQIVFPAHDEELFLQLISYIVLRTSSTGKPVFAPGGNTADHAHDALILACFAIADNYDELLNPVFASFGKTVSNEAFLPTFSIETEADVELAQDMFGGVTKGPVQIRRSMAYGVKNRNSRRPIVRKMF